MGERAIEVEGLVREFKKGPRAVDGIELFVDHGEIYGFLGPNSKYQVVASLFGSTVPLSRADVVERLLIAPVTTAGEAAVAAPESSE